MFPFFYSLIRIEYFWRMKNKDDIFKKVISHAKEYGFISVSAKPQAKIKIDNRPVGGFTPILNHKVTAGYHTVQATFPSLAGRRKTKNVKVRAGKTTPVFFSLK